MPATSTTTIETPIKPPSETVLRAFVDREATPDSERALVFVASTSGTKRDGLLLELDGLSTENFEANPVFLWAHDYGGSTLPIGKVTKLRKLKNRLDATVEFDESDDFAQRVEQKYRDGFLNAVSIGWRILGWERGIDGEDDFDFRVTESDLLDLSAVPVPGDPQALIKTQRDLLGEDGLRLAAIDEEDHSGDSTAASEPVEGAVPEEGDRRLDDLRREVASLSDDVEELAVRLEAVTSRLEANDEQNDESSVSEEPNPETIRSLSSLRDALKE